MGILTVTQQSQPVPEEARLRKLSLRMVKDIARPEVSSRLSDLRAWNRVLIHSHNLNLEGAPMFVVHLAIGLKRLGWHVDVIAPQEGALATPLKEAGVGVLVDPLALTDTVHMSRERWPTYSLILLNTILGYPHLLPKHAHMRRIPTVWVLHESQRSHWLSNFQDLRANEDAVFAQPDVVIFPAVATKNVYADLRSPLVKIIYYGILNVPLVDNMAREAARAELKLNLQDFVVVVVGTFEQRKNPMGVVRVARELISQRADQDSTQRRWMFLFLGSIDPNSQYEKSLQSLAAQVSPGQSKGGEVRLLKKIPHVSMFLRASDVFVCFSDLEAMPLTILEAMAHGLPVVSTNVFGIPEAVEDGITGLLVPPRDEKALHAALSRLEHDPKLVKSLGSAGRQRQQAVFSVDVMVSQYDSLFARILARRQGWGDL